MTAFDATVIIPAHNAEADIAAQLTALTDQSDAPNFEVIVVANRCTDRTIAMANGLRSKLALTALEATERLSAAYARNCGAGRAASDRLLFCDADDEVSTTWVRSMHDALDEADYVGGIVVLDTDGLPSWMRKRFLTANNGPPGRWDGRINVPISASMGVRRTAFDAVGGFDEEYLGAAGEDTDLAIRLGRAGYRYGIANDAHFRYRVGGPTRALLKKKRDYARAEAAIKLKYGDRREVRPAEPWSRLPRRYLGGALKRREIDPRRAWVAVLFDHYRAEAEAAVVAKSGADRPTEPALYDFTVPTETPHIGGLLLQAPNPVANAFRHATEGGGVALLDRLLDQGSVVVDVGAAVGLFSLTVDRVVGEHGVVHAFEPDPLNCRALRSNVLRHPPRSRLLVHELALSDEEGEGELLIDDCDRAEGLTPSRCSCPDSERRAVVVRQRRLDDVIDGRVDLLRVEAAGLAPRVLAGAERLLEQSEDATLILEADPGALAAAGHTLDDLLALLSGLGRESWVAAEDEGPASLRLRNLDSLFTAMPPTGGRHAHLVAVPSTRLERIADLVDG